MTRRLPQIAFGLLVLATIGAFFLVQALKTAPPLVWGPPVPIPSAINPIHGRLCRSRATKAHPHGVMLDYRASTLTLAVSHTDTVGVYIVSKADAGGAPVATITTGTPMQGAPGPGNAAQTAKDSRVFRWNGLLADGMPAPDGIYYFRIVLEREDRSANLSQAPVQVLTQPPDVRIRSVRLFGGAAVSGSRTESVTATTTTTGATSGTTTGGKGGRRLLPLPGPAVLSSPASRVRITFTPGAYRRAWIDIYRTDVAGRPELVDPLPVTRLGRDWTTWNGQIGGAPAPDGTYLVGITAQDLACNRASWPLVIPPAAGTTPHAGVTVRHLSVTPPLTPTVSGSRASVAVDSAGVGFSWRLRRAGSSKVLAHGSGSAGSSEIRVPMPRRRAGLYTLMVRAGTRTAAVPLVASQAGAAAAHTRVLVVLPMLTWMGNTAVDDTGDGLPDTLSAGEPVSLARPLVDGLPAGFGEDARLLEHLAAEHLSYQLTTDVALAEGNGPSLADRGGVIFPAGEDFLPAGLELTLRGFVRGGGRVLALGSATFGAVSHISGFPAAARAGAPRATLIDPFGARRGPVTPTGGELISRVTADGFNLFGDAGEFGGFSQYQPITPPASAAHGAVSAVGIGGAAPAIVAFHYGSGTVVEVGLAGFAASLAHNADSANLMSNIWQLLSQ